MYPNNGPWRPSPSSSDSSLPANNPFLENSAASRFPALDTSQQSFQTPPQHPSQSLSPAPSQFQQQLPYGPPQNQQQYLQWNGPQQQQPQSPTYGPGAFTGYGTPQQQSQLNGFASFGSGQQYGQQSPYGSQPQLQPQFTGYPQYQQPPVSPQQYQQHQKSVITQFDPYSGVANGWNGQNQNQNQNPGSAGAPSSNLQRIGPSGQQHPRSYIQSHKGELESWNAASWKQALLTFEELKRTWEVRRAELQKHLISGQYLSAADTAQVNGMIRSSEANIDSVTASLIQMQEVHSGYKHSLDGASKQRVREALNAGLQGLPEWP